VWRIGGMARRCIKSTLADEDKATPLRDGDRELRMQLNRGAPRAFNCRTSNLTTLDVRWLWRKSPGVG